MTTTLTTENLHRIHAAPAAGLGGRSFDVGPFRWRAEGGPKDGELARAVAHRLALCWNLCEGARTATLEDGAILREAEAHDALLDAIERGADLAEIQRLAAAARQAANDLDDAYDRTGGRLNDCPTCNPAAEEA